MSQVKLDHWRPHVLAALQAQQSFAQYAREHGVSRHTLYVAHKRMKAGGEVAPTVARPKPVTRTAFVPVQVTPGVSTLLTVRLSNGVVLQFTQVDAPLLQWLASLPCLN